MDLHTLVSSKQFTAEEVRARQLAVYRAVLEQSAHLKRGNFTQIHPRDLELLFEQYDARYLDGACRRALGSTPLRFRLSKRLTSSAGITTWRTERVSDTGEKRFQAEIAVSTTLLFQTFQEELRPVDVAGCSCRNRLEALQRVFEHELVHLCEQLIWNNSNCSAHRFQSIARRLFGHTAHRHRLITGPELALRKHGIRPGDRVTFRIDNRELRGVVNRITRRATVLVEDPSGERYNDGKRYRKWYVPLSYLSRASE